MKVAIDVHSLGTQAGGNETFYRQLLEGLSLDSGSNKYTLLYTQPQAPSLVTLDRRFDWLQIPANPVRRICFSIPALLDQLKPDVFHCQYVLPPRVKTKTVVTIHDLVHEQYPEFAPRVERFRMRRLVPWSARRADHIITVSEYSAKDIASRYRVPRSKISVAYQAPAPQFRPREKDLARNQIEKKYGIRAPFILYVGRLQARKNLVRLTEAYARIRKQHPDILLAMVGKPDLHHEKLLAKVEELNLKGSVIFPGYVSADDLPVFYNAAEMFVFPSIFEGFGLPVMESMASGVPTITSQGSCLAEVAGDGALFVDPQSVDSIANAILRILGSADLRRHLIERGLLRSTCFSTTAFAGKVLEVYKSLA